MAGRPPDYKLAFLNKKTGQKGNIGAAWKNDDGSLTIVFNPQTVIVQNPDVVLTLFPKDYVPKKSKKPVTDRIEDPAFEGQLPAPF